MKQYDKMMALIRNPEYLEDYEKLKRLRSADDRNGTKRADIWAKKIGTKWGEYPPPRPLPNYIDTHSKIFKSGYSGTGGPAKVEVLSTPLSGVSLSEIVLAASQEITGSNAVRSKSKTSKNGQYLTFKVDLTGKTKHIMRAVEHLVIFYGKFVQKEKTRNREPMISPWLVYDLKHKKGKNLLQVTKDLFDFGPGENPAYNERLKARYEQVKRLYKKAEVVVSQVRPLTSA